MSESMPYFEEDSNIYLDACPFAETSYAIVFADFLEHGLQRAPLYLGFDVFMREDEPIFLRKSHNDTPTSISFTAVNIAGTVRPAGSIFRIDTTGQNRNFDPKPSLTKRKIKPISDIARISFLRTSGFVDRLGSAPENIQQLGDVRDALKVAAMTEYQYGFLRSLQRTAALASTALFGSTR